MYNIKKRTCLRLFWNKMRNGTIDNETSLKEGGAIEFFNYIRDASLGILTTD